MQKVLLKENWLGAGGVFFLSAFYFSIWGQSVIQYQNDQHLFLYTKSYLQQFLNMPGGITQWLSAFFTQFYHFPLVGALVVAFLITTVFLLFVVVLKRLNTPYENSIAALFSIILTTILQNYESSLLPVLAVLITLLFIVPYLSVNKWWLRLTIALLSVVVLYIVEGAFFWLFVGMVMLIEGVVVKGYKRYIGGVILLIASLLLPYFMALHHYFIFIEPAYLHPLQTKAYTNLIPLGLMILVLLFATIVGKRGHSFQISGLRRYRFPQILTVIVICMGAIFVIRNHNSKVSDILNIAQAGKNQQWESVLEISCQTNVNNVLMPYYTNLALSQKGELLDKLFFFSQKPGAKGLYFTWEKNQHLKEHGGAFFYTVGYVNEAHHWAFESLVQTGPVAPVLKDLIRYNMVLGKTENAQKYLNVLKQSLFYRKWAVETESICHDSLGLSQLNWIQHKRRQIPSGDYFMDLKTYEKDLVNLVASTHNNKSAVDYLIAFYLLSNQPQKVIANLPLIKQYYPVLPVTVQEVCSAYAPAMVTDKEVMERFQRYKKAVKTKKISNSNTEMVNSFWFYADFICPHQRN